MQTPVEVFELGLLGVINVLDCHDQPLESLTIRLPTRLLSLLYAMRIDGASK